MRMDESRMNRRQFLASITAAAASPRAAYAQSPSFSRVRPGDAAWPADEAWDQLDRDTGGRLVRVQSPLAVCAGGPGSTACADVFTLLKNPYAIGDNPALT